MTGETVPELALSPFERQIKVALRLYDNPDRLGQESPLASAYVLGRSLRGVAQPITARARGELLRGELRAAADTLWPGRMPSSKDEMLELITEIRRDPSDQRYAFVVLELRCFHRFIEPLRTSDIWEQPHLLPGSKSQHYRDFDAAVKRVAAALLDSLRPATHPERPRAPEALYGYDGQIAQLCDALARGHAVVLNGAGGVGKTSLASTAIAQLGASAFWYTLRPGLNDGANSLLYALGAFLHERGAANLWQYLATSGGVAGDLNLAAGLLRQDLATFQTPPILCFDDLEHLLAGSLALPQPAHTQLLQLIEEMRGSAPLLMISQRPLPACDLRLELDGLCPADVERLWASAGRSLSDEQAGQLHAYTAGNPRLLLLLLALQQTENAELPDLSGAAASLVPAFQRLWLRLTADERHALQRLAVYGGYAPDDVLEAATLDSLARLRLVEQNGKGGVAALPAIVPVVYEELEPSQRRALHSEAAVALLERGEHTAAADHFARAEQGDYAVQCWFPQRGRAIARGEADAARRIFGELDAQLLGRPERKALEVILAELRQLAGQHAEALGALEQAERPTDGETSARLLTLRGELQDALGYPDKALESYAEGARITARLLGRLAALHQRRGVLLQRGRDLRGSWGEIHRAEFELEVLRGLVREEEGDYHSALECYRRARALAEQLDDDSLRAQAERWLAAVYGRRQQLAEAVAHAASAIAIYERIGDRVGMEKMRSNLSFIYVQTREFQAALDVAAPAFAFFTAVRDPYFAAVTGANLAEASFELGNLAAAERYASAVLALGQRFTEPYARFTLGQVALARGEAAAGAAHFADSMRAAQANDDPYMVAYAERSLGQALIVAGDSAAEEHIQGALALFRQLDIPGEIEATEALLAGVAV